MIWCTQWKWLRYIFWSKYYLVWPRSLVFHFMKNVSYKLIVFKVWYMFQVYNEGIGDFLPSWCPSCTIKINPPKEKSGGRVVIYLLVIASSFTFKCVLVFFLTCYSAGRLIYWYPRQTLYQINVERRPATSYSWTSIHYASGQNLLLSFDEATQAIFLEMEEVSYEPCPALFIWHLMCHWY